MAKDTRIIQMAVYSVRKDRLKVVLPAVKKFVKTVNKKEPGTIVYVAYQKKDRPHEFVHFMVFKNKRAKELHKRSRHVKKFVDVIYPNATSEPTFVDLNKLL